MAKPGKRDQRKKRQKRRPPSAAGQAAASTPSDDLPEMPPRTMMERAMRGMFGGPAPSDPVAQAQELAYDAMEAAERGDVERAVELAQQACDLHPHCVDALLLLSQAGSENRRELIENLRRTVEVAAEGLGDDFEEMPGRFWGFHETRPYMRARAMLAQMLAEAGKHDEAIEHYEEMLNLNPGDNQGLRYELMGLYLLKGNLDGVRWLFEQYEDEGSAVFAWGRVLERYLDDDEPGALAALERARKGNEHVEAYLLE